MWLGSYSSWCPWLFYGGPWLALDIRTSTFTIYNYVHRVKLLGLESGPFVGQTACIEANPSYIFQYVSCNCIPVIGPSLQ